MLFHEIEYFLAVADCLSFSKAASQLFLSQPALSKVIAGLEDELGAKLLRRSTRKVELTEAGSCFYTISKRYLEQLEMLVRGRLDQQLTGSLTIGFDSLLDASFLPFIIAAFRQKHPRIQLGTRVLKTEDLLQGLRSGKLDMGLVSSFSLPQSGYFRVLLYPYELQAVLWKEHPLAGRPSLRLDDLRNENFLVLNPSESKDAEIILRMCEAAGFAPRASECVFNYRQMFLLASQKEGIAFHLGAPQAADYWELTSVPVDLSEQAGLLGETGVTLAWWSGNENPAIGHFTSVIEVFRPALGSGPIKR